MTEGDVCLAALPQSDGQLKDRPILLLKAIPPFGDMLVCGISS
jgi:mRNA interferase MazF